MTAPTKIPHKLAGHSTMAGRAIKLDVTVPEEYFNLQPVSDAGSVFVLWVVPIGAPAFNLIQRNLQQRRQIHGTDFLSYEPDSDYPFEYCKLQITFVTKEPASSQNSRTPISSLDTLCQNCRGQWPAKRR